MQVTDRFEDLAKTPPNLAVEPTSAQRLIRLLSGISRGPKRLTLERKAAEAMSKRARITQNAQAWMTLVGAYAAAMVLADVAIQLLRGSPLAAGDAVVAALVSGLAFSLSSAALLLRHRTLSALAAASAGVVAGASVVISTGVFWLRIEPSFRHAVPLELLPLFVFPIVLGLMIGLTFYLASVPRAA